MTDTKRRFTVISNEELIEKDKIVPTRDVSYHSNPIKWQGQGLREDFMKFNNNEGGKRFSVEDLLNW